MRRTLVITVAVVASSLCASPAMAQSTVNISATFHDQVGGPVHSPFSCAPFTNCGSGEVTGLGQASQSITFFDACGPDCALQTITLADGSTLVTEAVLIDCSAPGVSGDAQPPSAYGHPFSCTFSGPVEGSASTGMFAGAAGTVAGELRAGGGVGIFEESGSITLA